MTGAFDATLSDERAALIGAGHGEALPVLEQWHGCVLRDPFTAVPVVVRHIQPVMGCLTDPALHEAAFGLLSAVFADPQGLELVLSGALDEALQRGVRSADGEVRWACAQFVQNVTGAALARGKVGDCLSSGLVATAVQIIADERTDVGTRAAKTVAAVARAGSAELQSSQDIMEKLRAVLKDPVPALRAIDALLESAADSRGVYDFADRCGALDAVATGLEEDDDVLQALNYLEVLGTIAASDNADSFFGRRPGLPSRVTKMAAEGGDETTACFALRFISRFAQHSAANGERAVAEGWFDSASQWLARARSPEQKHRSLECLCSIACTPAGVDKLLSSDRDVKVLRESIGGRPHSQAARELRVVAMSSVANALDSTILRSEDRQRLADAVFDDAVLADFLRYRTDQVTEVRTAFNRALRALVIETPTALRVCSDHGLWAWLLDLNAETDKQCREIKHSAIQRLIGSAAQLATARGERELMELRIVARLGPFVTRREQEPVHTVQTEGLLL
eukprot:TRINITY_DN6074_c0_g1_i1.p1 TRINITY_DN6074_c0_g1~~TRINITY_DN6074_c0_g1_i1.p1  ORF type:complete len:511 (+),score=161.09 TRINITY_DN6074_c0_g1_i1:81-1613(+)